MLTRLSLNIMILAFSAGLYAHPLSDLQTEPQGDLPSVFDSFYGEDALQVTLTTDLEALINDRNREEFQKAVFTYEDPAGEERSWKIEVKPRGKFRRRICDFPPVKMKFAKEELSAAGLNEHNDLKLVTHCLDDNSEGFDNLIREYLAYKLYNVLTPNSYRVQLVRITYRDSEKNLRSIKSYGFILEDTDEMAQRVGGEECDNCLNPEPGQLNPLEENLMSVFQYMIGNSDWSLKMARNLKYIKRPSGQLLPVPFDFDFSGLVSADYAVPNQDYGQASIQNRIFIGFQPSPEVLFQTLATFDRNKAGLYDEVKKQKLGMETRRFVIAYLDQFFYAIENGTEEQLIALFTPAKFNIPLTPDESKIDNSGGR